MNPGQNNDNYEENLDIAGYRTLVTLCETNPGLRSVAIQDILEFDYSRIINWALEVGLKDPDVKDYLIPFEDWLRVKSEELSITC